MVFLVNSIPRITYESHVTILKHIPRKDILTYTSDSSIDKNKLSTSGYEMQLHLKSNSYSWSMYYLFVKQNYQKKSYEIQTIHRKYNTKLYGDISEAKVKIPVMKKETLNQTRNRRDSFAS